MNRYLQLLIAFRKTLCVFFNYLSFEPKLIILFLYSRLVASQTLGQRDCFELARNLPWQNVGCARHKDAVQARLVFVFNSLSLEFVVLLFFIDECVSFYLD